MVLSRNIRRKLSIFLPSGLAKEYIKYVYYVLASRTGAQFSIVRRDHRIVYKTTHQNVSLLSHQALYIVSDDFNFYQHFYHIKSGDIIMDAGANVGILTMYFSKKAGPSGFVHAFEPDNINIAEMKRNFLLNPDMPANTRIYDQLLWNENTTLEFEEAGTPGSSAVWINDRSKVARKEAVSIDSWAATNHITRLDFIKMDIEGAEIQALDGARETISKFHPRFAIASYHVVNGERTYIKVEEFFRSIDYAYKTINFNGGEIITFAGFGSL